MQSVDREGARRGPPQETLLVPGDRPTTRRATASLPKHFFIIRALIEGEKEYIEFLGRIFEGFVVPLRSAGVVSKEDDATLLGNMEKIFQVNRELFKRLTTTGGVISIAQLAGVFEELGETLKVYEEYCANYKRAQDKLLFLMKQPAFSDFVEKCEVENQVNFFVLRQFLVKPIQRICTYPVHLKELTKYLPGDVNLDNWKKMLQMLEAIATHINISRSEAQEVEKLLDVQKKINNTSQKIRIAVAGRRLILEGAVKRASKQGKVIDAYLFLFDDVVVYCKVENGKYVYSSHIPIQCCVLRHIEDTDKLKNGFIITNVATKKSNSLHCSTPEEKIKWMQRIGDAITARLAMGIKMHDAYRTWEDTVDTIKSDPAEDENEIVQMRSLIKKQQEWIKRLENECPNLNDEVLAYRASLRRERKDKSILSENALALQTKMSKQKQATNKLWKYVKNAQKLGEAELKALENEINELTENSLVGAASMSSSGGAPGHRLSMMQHRNTERLSVYKVNIDIAAQQNPYSYSLSSDIPLPEVPSNDEVNLFHFISKDEEDEEHGKAGDKDVPLSRRSDSMLKKESELPDGIIKLGYLSKKGAKRRNWKDRWFVLKVDSISYYANPTDSHPKGTISLRRSSVATSTRKPFCFHVSNLNRDYYIVAKNQQEQKEWMEAIRYCIDELKKDESAKESAVAQAKDAKQRSAYQAGAEKEGLLMYEESPNRWIQNWISLKEGRLYLFSTRTDAWPHGVIELDGCVVEMETKPEEDKKRKKNKQFIFLISNPSIGSTRFSGSSERERAEWVTTIDFACRKPPGLESKEGSEENGSEISQDENEDDCLHTILKLYATTN